MYKLPKCTNYDTGRVYQECFTAVQVPELNELHPNPKHKLSYSTQKCNNAIVP